MHTNIRIIVIMPYFLVVYTMIADLIFSLVIFFFHHFKTKMSIKPIIILYVFHCNNCGLGFKPMPHILLIKLTKKNV